MANPINHEIQATNYFQMVPEEVIIKIFGLLDLQSLGRISSVYKLFEQLQKSDGLWDIQFGSKLQDKC